MNKLYRLSDPSSRLPPARYITEVRCSLTRIEELLTNAEGFRQVDARDHLKLLAATADNVCRELLRTSVAKVQP